MRLPAIGGVVRMRILVNYRVDAEAIQALLPSGFRPKLHNSICLMRGMLQRSADGP